MARRRKQVDAIGLHVDRQMPGRLGGIDDEWNPRLAGDLPDLADRLNCSGDVADVGDGDEPGVRPNRLANIARIDQPIGRIDRHARGRRPAALLQRAQGSQDRVVIDVRADCMAFDIRVDQTPDGHIERIGAVKRKDEMLGPLAVEKPIEPLAAFGDQLAGFHRLGIPSPPGAGAEFHGIPGHRVMNGPRFGPTCGGIVQIQPARSHTAIPLSNFSPRMIKPNPWNAKCTGRELERRTRAETDKITTVFPLLLFTLYSLLLHCHA